MVQDRGKSYLTAITPLVATRLMPKLGLAWIHEDYQLFVSWTHALLRFEDAFEDWGLIYDLRDIYEYTKELALQEVSSTAVEGKHEAGEVFWQWLQDGISSGSLPLNQSDVGIYVVNGEIVLDHERVFRQFSSGFHSMDHGRKWPNNFKVWGSSVSKSRRILNKCKPIAVPDFTIELKRKLATAWCMAGRSCNRIIILNNHF